MRFVGYRCNLYLYFIQEKVYFYYNIISFHEHIHYGCAFFELFMFYLVNHLVCSGGCQPTCIAEILFQGDFSVSNTWLLNDIIYKMILAISLLALRDILHNILRECIRSTAVVIAIVILEQLRNPKGDSSLKMQVQYLYASISYLDFLI